MTLLVSQMHASETCVGGRFGRIDGCALVGSERKDDGRALNSQESAVLQMAVWFYDLGDLVCFFVLHIPCLLKVLALPWLLFTRLPGCPI